MSSERLTWGGVDVGGQRKGFHVALIDDKRLVDLRTFAEAKGVAAAVRDCDLVAVDSPRTTARPGESTRECELRVIREVPCGIRWTPDARKVRGGNPYYEWICRGLELYRALQRDVQVIECFPTASWTRWGGARGKASRASWSARVLAQQGLADSPKRLNPDWRDAIGAALTARAHSNGLTEEVGEIVVPLRRRAPAQ